MSEKPIIFNGEMVRAILDGRKTQTRRVTKEQYMFAPDEVHTVAVEGRGIGIADGRHICGYCPYGKPGDKLWVKETFADVPEHNRIYYRADDPNEYDTDGKWSPSIYMPRSASRITLEITGSADPRHIYPRNGFANLGRRSHRQHS